MRIDLIEQLGGYEKAKFEFLLSQYYPSVRHFIHLTSEKLSHELLQYRKDKRFFEAGDKAVLINGEAEVFTTFSGVACEDIHVVTSKGFFVYSGESIRHATPEEIQAGRRLEVCGVNK